MKKNKYNAKKTIIDGIKFDSKKEAARYTELKLMEKGGVIRDLELQPRFDIVINGMKVCYYRADFSYMESGELVVEDVKSSYTAKLPVYRLKNKLMKAVHNITIKEV